VAKAALRYARLTDLLRQGLSGDEIAAELGCSRRSVFRAKRRLEAYGTLAVQP
jgi:biotin operon repressor